MAGPTATTNPPGNPPRPRRRPRRRRPVGEDISEQPLRPWQGSTPEAQEYRRKGRERRRRQAPFSPFESYGNVGEFEDALERRLRGQVDPLLGNITEQERREQGRHERRQSDLSNWYGAQAQQLGQAFSDTERALNNLIASRNSAGGQSQAALAAALRSTQSDQNALAQMLGAPPPPSDVDENVLGAAAAIDQAQNTGLTGQAVARVSAAGERRNIAPTGMLRASEGEARRYGGVQQEIDRARREIQDRVPSIREELRQRMIQDALQAGNLQFQQNLARDEFGLQEEQAAAERQNMRFQQRLALQQLGLDERRLAHQQNIDLAQLDLQAQEIQAAIEAAGSDDERADAEARGEAFARGADWLNSFLQRARGETRDRNRAREEGRPLYNRRPEEAYRVLTKRFGLSRRDAVRLIHSVADGRWERFSTRPRRPRRRGAGGAAGGAIGGAIGAG